MKSILTLSRFHLWKTRNFFEWAGFFITWDYHNMIINVSLLTYEFGCEYVWKNIENDLKKTTWGFSIDRDPLS